MSKVDSKAVYQARLNTLLLELYETMLTSKQRINSPKIEGFIEAGLCADVVSREEVEQIIDAAHLKVFGVRFTSKLRPTESNSEVLDIPTYIRDRKQI